MVDEWLSFWLGWFSASVCIVALARYMMLREKRKNAKLKVETRNALH